ncbi:ABC transporter ATP-binding protein [Chelatococcus sp. HY11]|uniref:ABC transporter ATP-binding protein n=1 Tax=unclassified Chelatococcus TaxID=2638111 RepID=UPI0032DE4B88
MRPLLLRTIPRSWNRILERRFEVLELSNVHVNYNGSAALRGVNLSIPAGKLVAVIGPNGAGKTTLLRTISGLVGRAEGSVCLDGEDLSTLEPDGIVRRGVVQVPEGRMVLSRMSVHDNIMLGAYIRPRGREVRRDFDSMLELFPRLRERLSQQAGALSGGEQQMLAIARGLMGRPRLLMLDEPSLGLAPLVVETIFQVLLEIKRKSITVLLVEQNAEKALAVADQGYVLDLGVIAAEGMASDLLGDEQVRRAYLGL